MFLTKGIKVNVFMLIVLQDKIDIFAIVINISETTQSLNGFVYPEISFFRNCECEPEHGICIGFRDKKFLGIQYQDWTL